MNLISVPSQLLEEAVVVLCMDVRSVRSGTVDGLTGGAAAPRFFGTAASAGLDRPCRDRHVTAP